jgi:hypothetical protein
MNIVKSALFIISLLKIQLSSGNLIDIGDKSGFLLDTPGLQYDTTEYLRFGSKHVITDNYIITATEYFSSRPSRIHFLKKDVATDEYPSSIGTNCSGEENQVVYSGEYQQFDLSTNKNVQSIAATNQRAVAVLYDRTEIWDYDSNTGTWVQQQTPIPYGSYRQSTKSANDRIDISDDGNTIIIGEVNSGDNYKGKIAVYKYESGVWNSHLVIQNYAATKKFGDAVAISGDGNVFAACAKGGNNNAGPHSGSYDITDFNTYNPFCDVYIWDGSNYRFSHKFSHNDISANPYGNTRINFGHSVELNEDGSKVFISHPNYFGSCSGDCAGSVYVYEPSINMSQPTPADIDSMVWTLTNEFKQSDFTTPLNTRDQFGSSIHYNGNKLVVGSPLVNSNCGGTFIYTYEGGAWLTNGFVGGVCSSTDFTQNSAFYGYVVSVSPNGNDFTMNSDSARFRTWGWHSYGYYMCFYRTFSGKINVVTDIPPPPTSSPTASPTTAPLQKRASVKVTVASDTSTLRSTFSDTKIGMFSTPVLSEWNNDYTKEVVFKVAGKERMVMFNFDAVNSSGAFSADSILESMGINGTGATVTFSTFNGTTARILQGSSTTTVEISYDLSESQFLGANSLNDPSFLSTLSGLIGVPVSDIDVDTNIENELTISIDLYAAPPSANQPLGTDTIDDIQDIQDSLTSVTSAVAATLGVDSTKINTPLLDVCSVLSCFPAGTDVNDPADPINFDPSKPHTDQNGCISDQGYCLCNNGYWGIDCGTTCQCNNNSVDGSATECIQGECKCKWPDHGINCELTRSCNATCTF